MSELAREVIDNFGQELRTLAKHIAGGDLTAEDATALQQASIAGANHKADVFVRKHAAYELAHPRYSTWPGDDKPVKYFVDPEGCRHIRSGLQGMFGRLIFKGRNVEDVPQYGIFAGYTDTYHVASVDDETMFVGRVVSPEDEVGSIMISRAHLKVYEGTTELSLGTLEDIRYPNAVELHTPQGNIPLVGDAIAYDASSNQLLGFHDSVHPQGQVALAMMELFYEELVTQQAVARG